jgi:SAM-dependent methyltransferase
MTQPDYSPDWYAIFLDSIPEAQTQAEVAFITRQLPLASHQTILDVCCGPGRHANALARHGYRVLGVDNNASVIARARSTAEPGALFQQVDMRRIDSLTQQFDGVISVWASFGYFDDVTNAAILRQIAAKLRPGGRAVIDVYNRAHMTTLPTAESAMRAGVQVSTQRVWLGNRLRVRLSYDSTSGDEFEWRVYTPDELTMLCSSVGLDPLLSCAWFTEALPPSAEHARMQLVLERRDDR